VYILQEEGTFEERTIVEGDERNERTTEERK
jgi:hypothetical protein